VSNWEIAWITIGCIAYLAVGYGIVVVMTMDCGPDNPLARAALRFLGMILWLPALIIIRIGALFFAE
jgi:hypothetical protein